MAVAVPMAFAALMLAFSRWRGVRNIRLQQTLLVTAVTLNLGVALTVLTYTLQGNRIVYQLGLWPAPFGITVVADALTGIMLTSTATLVAVIAPYAFATMDYHRERFGFYPLILFLVMGVNMAFIAGDLFNLYVSFEVMLMSSFVLLTLGGTPNQINGGIRYVLLNLLASLTLLTAAGMAYGTLGTLNFAHLAQRMDEAPLAIRTLLAGLMFIAFGGKAAIFPLFFWLPSSYHTPPPAVTALFGGILTKVGVYTLYRTFPLLFPDLLIQWQTLIFIIAGLTMTIGVLGAFAQPTIRRLLSFHIISQVGYMIMALGVAVTDTRLGLSFGLAAGIIFVVHNMFVKTALMMAGGAVELEMGSGNLSQIGGLVGRQPVLATLFFVAAFSLAGLPAIQRLRRQAEPSCRSRWARKTTGSRGERLRESAHDHEHDPHLAVLVLGQVSGSAGPLRRRCPAVTITGDPHPHGCTDALSLTIGIFFGQALNIASIAADQVVDREGYIAAVHPQDSLCQPDEHEAKE
ncbi:MAG: proton-conducting transporter membrane subunit [Caldilineaceae bacterium]